MCHVVRTVLFCLCIGIKTLDGNYTQRENRKKGSHIVTPEKDDIIGNPFLLASLAFVVVLIIIIIVTIIIIFENNRET
jgi:hypothetical protein